MEIILDPLKKQALDDLFDAFSMISGGSIVNMMHVDGGVTRWSPGAVDLLRLPGEYIPNGAFDWETYLHPEDRKRYRDIMAPLLTGERRTYDLTYRVRIRTGEYMSFRATGAVLRNDDGKPSMIGGLLINQGLTQNTDPITVLSNKHQYFDDLESLLQTGQPTFTLLTGISRLSRINERYGYTYGNRVLQEVAWLIQETVNGRGSVYRMDGATFAFLTYQMTRQEVGAIYDSIRMKLQRGIHVDGSLSNLIANGGLISTDRNTPDTASVYACLTHAYHESKRRRHGDLVDFNGSINYDARESLDLIHTIRGCILDNCEGFSVKYQPVFDAQSEKLLGVEALLRWNQEPYGEVLPLDFLPILEKDFVFEELGSWIIDRILRDGLELLRKRPDILIGFNVSAAQLEDEYFIDSLTEALDDTGFPAEKLCIELTENCRMLDVRRLREIVRNLRRRHIRVFIDDFGSGFNSIGCLKEISADHVKLDLALMRGMEHSEADRQTLRALAELATVHGAGCCIKGVENQRVHDIVKRYPIRSMQGDYYSKPIPFADIVERYCT